MLNFRKRVRPKVIGVLEQHSIGRSLTVPCDAEEVVQYAGLLRQAGGRYPQLRELKIESFLMVPVSASDALTHHGLFELYRV